MSDLNRIHMAPERRICNPFGRLRAGLLHTRILFAALLVFFLLFRPAEANNGGETTVSARTRAYQFIADKSTITQTGGIAGIHRTYTLTGTFRLIADFEAGTAFFDVIDAGAVYTVPSRTGTQKYSLDPKDVFNMMGLAGTIMDGNSILFEGMTDDGSSVKIMLTLVDDCISLKGETVPPPNSADFFIFTLDAVAEPKYEYGGGSGTADDPYRIYTAEQMNAVGANPIDWDKHFKLMADIDLAGFDGKDGRPAFNIIGTRLDSTFTGVFDGNNNEIFNFSHDTHYMFYIEDVGLFGILNDPNAEIKNLGLINPRVVGARVGSLLGRLGYGKLTNCYTQDGNVEGAEDVGGLVGYNLGGTITDCHSTSTISGGVNLVGGLVGNNFGTIINCYSTGTVSGNQLVGGLVGCNGGDVTNCYSTGTVSGSKGVGGLVGDTWDATTTGSSVTYCYSTAEVNGEDGVGGLVGNNSGNVANCHASGAVSGTSAAGGLVGRNRWPLWGIRGSIHRCYSTSVVSGGGQDVGGLVGLNVSAVTDSLWNVQASGQSASAGGTGKTTTELQMAKTFLDAGWDFVGETANGTEDIWWILEGKDYPRLWWQLPSDDFEDGIPEPLWFAYEMTPELAWLEETNGRLQVNTTGAMENVDAIYVSDGWQLGVNEPFAVRIDYHFSKVGFGDGRLTLGLVPTIAEPVVQWAQFEVGTFDDRPFFLYEVRDDEWVEEKVNDRFSDDGTMFLSYNPDTDELYLSSIGYGKTNAMWTITALVSGRWQSDSLYITIGGGSEDGMALTGEDAWLDNLKVDSGRLILN